MKRIILLLILITPFGLRAERSNEFPLVQAISYFPFNGVRTLGQGDFEFNADVYLSNIYMFDHSRVSVNDFEVFNSMFCFRYGLMPSLTLEVDAGIKIMNGGFLDRTIEEFHSAFSLPDNHRGEYPVNSVHYSYKDYFNITKRTTYMPAPVFSLLGNFYRDEMWQVNYRVGLGIPLKTYAGPVSDKPFLNAGLIASYASEDFDFSLSGYLSFFKKPEWLEGEHLKSRIVFTNINMRYKTFIFGFSFKTSPFKSGDLSHRSYQAYGGFRIADFMDILLIEDFKPFDTTPDVTLNFRFHIIKSR